MIKVGAANTFLIGALPMCNEPSGIRTLEFAREKKGLTIVAFTNLLPIQRSTYYGWKSGKRKPDPYRMAACLKIAEKLK